MRAHITEHSNIHVYGCEFNKTDETILFALSFRGVFPKPFYSRTPFWLREITTDPAILAQVYIDVRMAGIQRETFESQK